MKEMDDCLGAIIRRPASWERRERLKRRDAREHRLRILGAAQELFSRQGVDAVSMHQIAMAAGIGQGTLYRCYAHKGELCMDLLYERHEQFVSAIEAFFAAAWDQPVLERLRGFLKRMVAFLEAESDLLGPIAQVSPLMRQSFCADEKPSRQEPFDWLYQLFTGLFTEAVARGELAPFDIEYTADALLTAIFPLTYRFLRRERGFSAERILQGLYHIYIDGLKTPQQSGSSDCQ